MNNQKTTLLLFSVVLFILFGTYPRIATSQTDNIIVNDADSILNKFTIFSQNLVDTTAVVTPRVVFEHANSNVHYDLLTAPVALQTTFTTVSPRNIVQYANSTAHHALVNAPTDLQASLNTVTPRVVVQYANSTYAMSLGYPLTLMDDTTPPQTLEVTAVMSDTATALITWTTNEFATSEVMYGTQSGSYPQTVSDPLYVKDHAVPLNNVILGATYYYRVRSVDRSGNETISSEYSFVTLISVYLPFTTK